MRGRSPRVRFTARGDITLEDMRQAVKFQIRQGGWIYGSLYDAAAATSFPSIDDIRILADHLRALTEAYGPRGPVAVVGASWGHGGTSQLYAAMTEKLPFEMKVFSDLADAERWLDERPIVT
jgi:hypothetical protein